MLSYTRQILTHITEKYGSGAGFSIDLTIFWISNDVIRTWFLSPSFGFLFLYVVSFRKTLCKSWQDGHQQCYAFMPSSQQLHWVDKSPMIESHCTEFHHIPTPKTFRMLWMARPDSGIPFSLKSERVSVCVSVYKHMLVFVGWWRAWISSNWTLWIDHGVRVIPSSPTKIICQLVVESSWSPWHYTFHINRC